MARESDAVYFARAMAKLERRAHAQRRQTMLNDTSVSNDVIADECDAVRADLIKWFSDPEKYLYDEDAAERRNENSVVDAAMALAGHATGSSHGMQQDALDKLAKWLMWRIDSTQGGWVKSREEGSTEALYDESVRMLAWNALNVWRKRNA